MGVLETTFYCYVGYALKDRPAHKHENYGLQKPQAHTIQVMATLRCILNKLVDHMPHRSCILMSGEKVVSKVMLATWKWKESISKINTVNSTFGLKDVFVPQLNKIRKLNFQEYDAKKPGDNFGHCSTCDKLHSLRKTAILGSMLWARKLKIHLDSAMAHHELYSANRYRSKFFLGECVRIMHDKIDHAKTMSPVFSHKTKELYGLMKLPLSVTSMLAYGHGDV